MLRWITMAAAAAALFTWARGRSPKTQGTQPVRPAGPPPHAPQGWDRVDEAADGSFPASDPPARY